MYVLEAVFLLLTAAWLVVTTRRGTPRSVDIGLFLAGLGVAAAAFALDKARIHMVPAAVLFAVLSLLLFRRGYSHVVFRATGALLGSVFIAASVLLAFALPVVTLLAPDGPHTVGVTSFTLVDKARDESAFGVPGRPREIYVQVWYPAATPDEAGFPRPRSLWAELSRPPFFDVLFGYLRGIATHSYDGLPLSRVEDSYPAVVFSPSLGGIAEQNTLLMEHLASHGYIVFGVTHPHFGLFTTYADGSGVPPHEKTRQAMSQQGAVDLDEIAERAEQAGSELEAARIRLEYFDRGTMLNDFMPTWEHDLDLVLDAITMASAEHAVPTIVAGRVDASRLGLLGMSYGGGAVTQVCKSDARCRAALNLDGGLWGSKMREPLKIPYLVLASPSNARFFEHDRLTSEAPYYALTVEGTAHSSFTDASAFVPLFRWLGVTGTIDGNRVIDLMNVVARRFFDTHVRGESSAVLEPEGFPEVRTQTNAAGGGALQSAGSMR
jgi:predicted dienelactone hydrolase